LVRKNLAVCSGLRPFNGASALRKLYESRIGSWVQITHLTTRWSVLPAQLASAVYVREAWASLRLLLVKRRIAKPKLPNAGLNLPFGVNLPIPVEDDAMLKFVCDSGVKFVITSAVLRIHSTLKMLASRFITPRPWMLPLSVSMRALMAWWWRASKAEGFKNPEDVSTWF